MAETRTLDETNEQQPRETWPEEERRPTGPRGYFRQHPRAAIIALIVVIIIIVAAVLAWRYYAVRESTDDAQTEGHIVNVAARVGGTVVTVDVDDNQQVKPGDVLVQLDPKDYQVALERARADYADQLANARAASIGVPITSTGTTSTTATAQAALAAANQQVQAARARQQEARANFTKVNADLKRAEQLIAKDEISRQQYDAAVAAQAAARATVDASNAAVASAEAQVRQAEAGVRSAQTGPQQIQVTQAKAGAAQASAQKAQAALQMAELNLQYTTVRAPFAGIVSKKTVEPGQVVQAGQPLMAVVDLEDIWVVANFKETQLKNMHPGQSATCHVDAFNKDYKCHVDSIGGATGARFSLLPPENATGNYVKVVQRVPVKLVFEKGQDTEHRLRPGLSVVPTVLTK